MSFKRASLKAPQEYMRMSNLLRPYVHQLRNAPYVKRIHNLLNLPTNPDSGNSVFDLLSESGNLNPMYLLFSHHCTTAK